MGRRLHDDDGLTAAPGQIGAQVIRHAPGGDLDQPAARILGNTLFGPLQSGGEERLLNGVFRGGKVPEPPDDRAEHLRRELTQQMLGVAVERRHRSSGGPLITCRTSIGMLSGTPPLPGAADTRAAIS